MSVLGSEVFGQASMESRALKYEKRKEKRKILQEQCIGLKKRHLAGFQGSDYIFLLNSKFV